MKNIFCYLIIFFLISICYSCNTEGKKEKAEVKTVKIDSVKKDSVILVAPLKRILKCNRKFDDLARFIAGLPQDTGSSLDSNIVYNGEWKKYADDLNKNWEKYDTTRIRLLNNWTTDELKKINSDSTIVFYPFSGADVLNAVTFFPKAKQFVMVGLEPFGSLPSLKNDSISDYLKSVKKSLNCILEFSFFRTIAMASDFRQRELNGTVHLMLWFLERTNHHIEDIKPVAINSSGELINYGSFDDAIKDTLKNKGVEITFFGNDSIERKVSYFSVDLSNPKLGINQGFMNYVNSFDSCNTYLKSASYLMHKPYFSIIRELILSRSKHVLQDDSGIPYRFFADTLSWNITCFGNYSGTIPMFNNYYQKDLEQAFKSTKTQPMKLPFGIGYKYKKGESNLMLAEKVRVE